MWPEGLIAKQSERCKKVFGLQRSPVGLTKIRCAYDDALLKLWAAGFEYKDLFSRPFDPASRIRTQDPETLRKRD